MEAARAAGTAGLARDVLERARRRAARAGPVGAGTGPERYVGAQLHAGRRPCQRTAADEDRERLDAAFASILKFMGEISKECEKYYGGMAARKCKQHEVRHFSKYHGRQREIEVEPTEEEGTEGATAPSQAQTCRPLPRRTSQDFYIEVFPGIYSVTAVSDDMMQETHIVDVNAGQIIDLTFGL